MLLVYGLVVGAAWWAFSAGPVHDFVVGCPAIVPRELPSGAVAGVGTEGVTAGAKQLVWGHGNDRVEEIVGQSFFESDAPEVAIQVGTADVHGNPAIIYQLIGEGSPDFHPAFSWTEAGCDHTVVLAPGTWYDRAIEYAGRF